MNSTTLDPQKFRRIALRNTLLPLGIAAVVSAVFIGLILHLVSINKALNHSDQVIAGGHELLHLVVDAETGQRGYVITSRDSFLDPFRHTQEAFPERLRALEELVADNSAQVGRLKRIEVMFKEWNEFAGELMSAGNRDSARRIVLSERGKKIVDQIRVEMGNFIRAETLLRDERNENSQESVRVALVFILFSMVVVGTVLALYSRRQLVSVSNIYGKALVDVETQSAALSEQNWLRTAQNKASDAIRGDLRLEEVGNKALSFLCEYLDAKVGVLYVLEGNELQRYASYALNQAERETRERVRMGESLAGQAAAENRFIFLDPAPQKFLTVSSLLGAADSTSVMIAPLVADNRVRAVVELGFTRPLQARDQEVLRLVSENIAISIVSAQNRLRLQELLEESQRQAEELQAQQEELRVNNEELEEQSNALKESQMKLESQQAELEQTNSQLSQQARSLEQQNDELSQTRTSLELKAMELQRASEYKSQFLANMSHELRTPLNSTLILSQLLIDNKSGHLSSEEVEYARTILSSSNDLLSLINDILDLAKVEAGKVDLQAEEVELQQVVGGLEKTFGPMASNKGIGFECKVRPDTPGTFETDRLRLEQILRNLLSNALKFTEEGRVTLEVYSPGEGKMAFAVKDTGVGIPRDKQQVIFEAFQQADGTTNRRYGGTGLGLTISRDLARLLHGSISVESEPGKGSVFTLVVSALSSGAEAPVPLLAAPLASRAAEPARKPARAQAPQANDDRNKLDPSLKLLMVVEDDQAFAQVIRKLSHEVNFQCVMAHYAEEAVSMAEEYLPNAIILDIHLPDHSGLFVLDRLKENPLTRHIPVHIISANDFSQAALQMGAVGYLNKPASRDDIIDVIRKLEGKLAQGIKKVLIVEDNGVQLESMKKLIADEDVEVAAARTGAEAIDLLQSASFDCLILDLSLPDMSGYEILERMNASESLSHPPVIVYTGRDLSRAEEEKLQRYSDSIILKGVKSPERLLSEVNLFLHQVESKMPADRQKVLRDLRDRERDLDGKIVLLVDDDVRNIFALKNALEQRGARIEIARNGREAVEKVRSSPAIDLVLMDIMMPEMNGYEATREIRRDPRFKSLPIIAVTAKAMADDQEKCLEAGANDYLAKPIDLPKLLSLIRVWLHPARKV